MIMPPISPEEAWARFSTRWILLLEEGSGFWIAIAGFLLVILGIIYVTF